MRYAFKKARRVRLYDIATGQHLATIRDTKNAKFTGDQETQYAEGLDGAKLAAFDLNKVAGFEATNGAVDTDYLALQVGGTELVVKNGTGVMVREVLETADGNTVTLAHKATGVAGNEIGFVYAVRADGNPGDAYAQAAAASATECAYDAETKTVTLPTGVFSAKDKVVVDYFPTFAEYREIVNDANKFSKTVRAVVDAWFTDICSEEDVPMQVVMEKGKISGTIDMSYGDQAAVQNIKIESLIAACDEVQSLWTMFTYDEEQITE